MLIFLLFLNLCFFCSGVPFSVLSFDCDANPKACVNNLCRVRILRSKATVIDYMCYHPYPINHAELYLAIKKKGSKYILFEVRDDICDIFQKARTSPFFTRFFEEIRKYGGVSTCPLHGNLTFFGFPAATVLQHVLPVFLPGGTYYALAKMTDLDNNVRVFNATIVYSIK